MSSARWSITCCTARDATCRKPKAFRGRVPPIKDFAGFFLHSAEGRDFLIRVPGVAGSALSDVDIAELMNWMLMRYSKDQLPRDFREFTPGEVARLRQEPEPEPGAGSGNGFLMNWPSNCRRFASQLDAVSPDKQPGG